MRQVNERLHSFQATINELTRSLEFTQSDLDELRGEMKILQRERNEDKEKMQVLMNELQVKTNLIKELEDKTTYLDDYNRRNNLQIVGVEEQSNESWEQTAVKVNQIIENKLHLPKVDIERAHRVGPRRDQKSRPIIARFSRFCDREAVIRNAGKLRGTSIFINEDLSPASQAVRREQLPLLHQARRDGKIAYFRYTKLIVKEKQGSPSEPVQTSDGVVRGGTSGPIQTEVRADRGSVSGPVRTSVGVDRDGASGLVRTSVGGDRSGPSGAIRTGDGVDQSNASDPAKPDSTPASGESGLDTAASSSGIVTTVGGPTDADGTVVMSALASTSAAETATGSGVDMGVSYAATAAAVEGTGVTHRGTQYQGHRKGTRSRK